MTVSYPRQAFDHTLPVRRARRSGLGPDRLTGIAITVAIHVLIAAMALSAVHVARPRMMQELSVQIAPERKVRAVQEALPPPNLAVPAAVTVQPPEIIIRPQTPPPVAARLAQAPPMPPAPVAAPQAAAGETRDSYLGRLLAQLNRFKQYPRAARQAHIEGIVLLHFVMDAKGGVQSVEIARSSGRPVLDAEALALVRRAQPLPPLPADYPTRTLDAVVPVEFFLSR